MGLGLSTAWNAFRFNDGRRIIKEVKSLGFDEVELSFNLTKSIVREIASLVEKRQIKVRSLHNYCPIPDGFKKQEALPDCYSVASLDEEQRLLAVKYSKISLETAHNLNAQAVVLHCGRVEIVDRTREFIPLFYSCAEVNDPRLKSLKEAMSREREEKADAHFAAVVKSLEELSAYAGKLKIALGIENRYYFREIPSFQETGRILERFAGANVFYWHDTGHAQLWENLGFLKHQDYLDAYGKYLIGVHLHDIIKDNDHLAPSQGDFDFNLLTPYLKQDTIKTLEAHYPACAQDIVKAKNFLEKLYASD